MTKTPIQKEIDRITKLFDGSDSAMMELLDGIILEAARCRIDLMGLNNMSEKAPKVWMNPEKPHVQKILPLSDEINRTRQTYASLMRLLCNHLAPREDSDDGLSEYE